MTKPPPGVPDQPVTRPMADVEPVPAFVWLFLAGLVANMFSGNTALLGLPLGVDRPLFLLAIVLLVLDPECPRLQSRAVYWVMALGVAWSFWSWMSTGSLLDTKKAFALADRQVVPLAMFVLGAMIFTTWRRRLLLLKWMTVLGVYLGITAVGEMSGLDFLVWPHYILNPDLGIQFGRARGPFLLSEAMGMTSALCLFIGGVLAYLVRGWWRLIACLCMILTAAAVILSLTRTAWLSTVIAAVAIGLLVPTMRRWLPLGAAAVAGAIAAALTIFPSLQTVISDRLTTERSIYDRLNTNAAALRIVDSHPVTGIGWGRFIEVSGDWIRQADTYPITNVDIEVHNVFLARAAETGVPGAVLWGLAMLLGPVFVILNRAPTVEMQAWRLLALAAVIVWVWPTVSSPNNYPLPNNLIWLVAGVAGQGLLVRHRGSRPDVAQVPTPSYR